MNSHNQLFDKESGAEGLTQIFDGEIEPNYRPFYVQADDEFFFCQLIRIHNRYIGWMSEYLLSAFFPSFSAVVVFSLINVTSRAPKCGKIGSGWEPNFFLSFT